MNCTLVFVLSWYGCLFFFSSRRRHTRCLSDWSSDVCSSDLSRAAAPPPPLLRRVRAHGRSSGGGGAAAREPVGGDVARGARSEERRVGKEGRSGRSQREYKRTDTRRRRA